MERNVVGFYDNRSRAEKARNELVQAGFPNPKIYAGSEGPGLWDEIREIFGFADEQERSLYQEASKRGAVALLVEVGDGSKSEEDAIKILQANQPIDLDRQSEQWRAQGWTGAQQRRSTSTPRAETGKQKTRGTARTEESIPVVEEELQVGKRSVQHGGVRVHSSIVSKPVEEQVKLREERVNVERRKVDRPLTNADEAFRERNIELKESKEEPVVSKRAKVVEEVVVNKDVRDRTETVRDSVRRTDVQVEDLNPQEASAADRFGADLARDQRYRGRKWGTFENDARQRFEQQYPTAQWARCRNRIGQSFDRNCETGESPAAPI